MEYYISEVYPLGSATLQSVWIVPAEILLGGPLYEQQIGIEWEGSRR